MPSRAMVQAPGAGDTPSGSEDCWSAGPSHPMKRSTAIRPSASSDRRRARECRRAVHGQDLAGDRFRTARGLTTSRCRGGPQTPLATTMSPEGRIRRRRDPVRVRYGWKRAPPPPANPRGRIRDDPCGTSQHQCADGASDVFPCAADEPPSRRTPRTPLERHTNGRHATQERPPHSAPEHGHHGHGESRQQLPLDDDGVALAIWFVDPSCPRRRSKARRPKATPGDKDAHGDADPPSSRDWLLV